MCGKIVLVSEIGLKMLIFIMVWLIFILGVLSTRLRWDRLLLFIKMLIYEFNENKNRKS